MSTLVLATLAAPGPLATPTAPSSPDSVPPDAAKVKPPVVPITEEELVGQLSTLVRLGARLSGKAPLNPPELVRHQRLEQVRQAALEAAKKGPRPLI